MRGYVDEVLAILPFEPDAFARLNGPHCTYVGHPLAERLPDLRPNAEEARRRIADPPLVLVLPGSRRSEISRLAGTFGEAIAQVAARAGPLELVLPTLPHIAGLVGAATANWTCVHAS
jgi:lipid-A-disaccharide synthase